ncbi:MAG: CxxC-x17-CxxC domain-containing protein [Patescibacteria group bacterium]
MGNYDRNDRGGNRGGYAPRGRSSFGGSRGFDRGGGRSFDRGGDRQMFDAICSNCGKACQVPFRPTGEKPVYCSDCFEKMGGGNDSPRSGGFDRPARPDFSSRAPAPSVDQNKAQFEAINAKLDRLIKLLEPKAPEAVVSGPIIEEVKAPKVAKKPASKKKE